MIIDMNHPPKKLTLGDLDSGDVFQFFVNSDDFYMASCRFNKSDGCRNYMNLSNGVISADRNTVAVKKINNARLTDKVD